MIPIQQLTGRLGNQMFEYAYLYSQAKRGQIPDVYVQGEEFFDEFIDEIKALYRQNVGAPIDMVAIHVRRGKNPIHYSEPAYSENPFYVNLGSTDYYERAMDEFPNAKFLVFSDDIAWCKEQPMFDGCEFSEGNDEIEDLNLMIACEGVITANSSFSWWAGYLNKGKVIAPKEWYADGLERTQIPDSWIRI